MAAIADDIINRYNICIIIYMDVINHIEVLETHAGHEVKGTQPGVTDTPWQPSARGPDRPHSAPGAPEHKTIFI